MKSLIKYFCVELVVPPIIYIIAHTCDNVKHTSLLHRFGGLGYWLFRSPSLVRIKLK